MAQVQVNTWPESGLLWTIGAILLFGEDVFCKITGLGHAAWIRMGVSHRPFEEVFAVSNTEHQDSGLTAEADGMSGQYCKRNGTLDHPEPYSDMYISGIHIVTRIRNMPLSQQIFGGTLFAGNTHVKRNRQNSCSDVRPVRRPLLS